MPPVNDNFANALVLPSTPGGSDHSVLNIETATTEGGEPTGSHITHGIHNTVWYKWTPTVSGMHDFNTFGSAYPYASFDPTQDGWGGVFTSLAVWTDPGGGLASLVEVASNELDPFLYGAATSRVVFCAVAGQTYYIQVGTRGAGYLGNIALNWGIPQTISYQDAAVTKNLVTDITGVGHGAAPTVSGVYGGRLYFVYIDFVDLNYYIGSCLLDGTDMHINPIGCLPYPDSRQWSMCYDGLNVYVHYSEGISIGSLSGVTCNVDCNPVDAPCDTYLLTILQFSTDGHSFTELYNSGLDRCFVEKHIEYGYSTITASPNFPDRVHIIYSIYWHGILHESLTIFCPTPADPGATLSFCITDTLWDSNETDWVEIKPSLAGAPYGLPCDVLTPMQTNGNQAYSQLDTTYTVFLGTTTCNYFQLYGGHLLSDGYANAMWILGDVNSDQGYPVYVGYAPTLSYGWGSMDYDYTNLTVFDLSTMSVLGTIPISTFIPSTGLVDDTGAPITGADFTYISAPYGSGLQEYNVRVSDAETDIETGLPTRYIVAGYQYVGANTLGGTFGQGYVIGNFEPDYLTYINPPFSGAGFETTAILEGLIGLMPSGIIKDVMGSPPPCSPGFSRRALWALESNDGLTSGGYSAARWDNRCNVGWHHDTVPPNAPPGGDLAVASTWSSDRASWPKRYAVAGSDIVEWDIVRDGRVCSYLPPNPSIFWFYANGAWHQQNISLDYSLYVFANGAWHEVASDPDYYINAYSWFTNSWLQ